jgi:hypothetical protein
MPLPVIYFNTTQNGKPEQLLHYDDVLDGTALDANLEDNDPDEELSKSKFDEASDKIKRVFTFSHHLILVAENYRSKTFNIFLWVTLIVVFFVYAFDFQSSVGQLRFFVDLWCVY